MNSLRGAFLNKFPDLVPSFFSFNALAIQTNITSNQETQLFNDDYLGRLPKVETVPVSYNNCEYLKYDSDTLKKINPQKNYKSLLACQKDFATNDTFVVSYQLTQHSLQILDQVVDNIQQLQTINSQDIYSQVDRMRSSTQSDILLSL